MNERRSAQWLTAGLGLATIAVSGVAAVPPFMAITRDQPVVFYEASTLGVLNPLSPDYAAVRDVLEAAGIPDTRTFVQLVNRGTGPASVVRVRLHSSGGIMSSNTIPAARDRPIWVSIAADSGPQVGDSIASFVLNNFAASRPFTINIAFLNRAEGDPWTEVEIYYDGIEARRVASIEEAPALSLASLFRTPIIIFVVGVLGTFIVAIGVVLATNPGLARSVGDISRLFAGQLTFAIPLFGIAYLVKQFPLAGTTRTDADDDAGA